MHTYPLFSTCCHLLVNNGNFQVHFSLAICWPQRTELIFSSFFFWSMMLLIL
uniref:Uncharacterized protein n=1 Tax=Anguilla anguilla TaxID=7936 RepID=A0A0E9XAB4_ANGAN